jgi:hypothetical protein
VGIVVNRVLPAAASPVVCTGPASAGLIVGAGVGVARELTITGADADVAAGATVAAGSVATGAATVGCAAAGLAPWLPATLIAIIAPRQIRPTTTTAMIRVRVVGSRVDAPARVVRAGA